MFTVIACAACFVAGVIVGDRVRAYINAKKEEAVSKLKEAAGRL